MAPKPGNGMASHQDGKIEFPVFIVCRVVTPLTFRSAYVVGWSDSQGQLAKTKHLTIIKGA